MKWSFASVGLIMLGLFGIVIIMLFNDITVSNEQDYYTLKYATEASMLEAVDVAYYRLTGEIKISKEKFVENFTRRFTETSTFGQGNYGINFYQILEYPAKVSLEIYDKTSGYNIYTYNSSVDTTQADIVNRLSAILDGETVDSDKNGYEIIGSSEYFGRREAESTECEVRISIGINENTGEEAFRCIYANGNSEYQSISGSVISEGDIIFNTAASDVSNEILYSGSVRAVGTIKGDEDEIAYEDEDINHNKKYTDKNGEEISSSKIEFFSENKDKCTERKYVGTIKGTDKAVAKCTLEGDNYEYQDAYGHKISASNIEFEDTKKKKN